MEKRLIGVCLSMLFLSVLCSVGFAETMKTVSLLDLDSGLTSPAGNYRWLDNANQEYATSYQNSYDYTQANVQVNYYTNTVVLHGSLVATNLKPNFTYQLKLLVTPDKNLTCLESVGLTGRWWQEEWNWDNTYGFIWMNGWNLNSKGDGLSPSPNDNTYYVNREKVDVASPTGLNYRYTTYYVFDYFITDENGDAAFDFFANNSYHVVFTTVQRTHTDNDGPIKTTTFDADTSSAAYDDDYPEKTVGIFGEWERLPRDTKFLPVGDYDVDFMLTEESFHGSGLAGGWAAAVGGAADFTILEEPPMCEFYLTGDFNDDCRVDFCDFAIMAENWLIDCNVEPSNPACVPE